MNEKYQIKTVSEWLALPEIEIPVISSPDKNGKVYKVKNVGFFMADIGECSSHNIIEKSNLAGKIPLPTIVTEAKNHFRQFRLPVDLNEWAHSCVSLAASGMNGFPCDVEFGNLNGNIYAEFL